jgi:hypothetical protein
MRWLIMALASATLAGCMGGSIAQQLASSLAIRAADKITSNAIEAQQRKNEEERRKVVLKGTAPDEYWGAFVTSRFSTISPVSEPLPANIAAENKTAAPQATRLVRVEIWNLLVGEEKHSVLEKARRLGTSDLPPQSEWKRWQVATGGLEGDKNKPITFLIPPEFGRISSGGRAVVEMAELGDLNVARYPAK